MTLSPPTATVGHLPQEPDRRAGETVAAFLSRRTGVAAAQARWTPPPRRLSEGAPGADDAYAAALDRWLALGGADLDERAAAVAVAARIPLGSGSTSTPDDGAVRRAGGPAGLAALLLSRYDVLLLDEPTNDLDLDGLERLERFVAGPAHADGDRQPRPGVPRPHGQPGRRAGPRASNRSASTTAATTATSRSAT